MKIKDWSNRLIFATILITVVRYSAAFMASDLGQITGWLSDVVTFFLTLTGLGMGILDTLGGALLFNGWRNVMPQAGSKWSFKFKILTICVFGLVISGMVILVPFTVSRMVHESVTSALGGDSSLGLWLWAGMVNAIPYFLIAGIFIGNKMVETLELPESNRKDTSVNYQKISSNISTDWRRVRHQLDQKQIYFVATSAPKDIVTEFQKSGINVSPRTASNWRINARRELKLDNE